MTLASHATPADITSPVIVSDNAVLNSLCERWEELDYLALDTEFIRVNTFYPKLGLLQVCDGSQSYLLDPLNLTDWAAFVGLLQSSTITKVLHSCSEDLIVFNCFFNCVPAPLFDTQIAAAFLGHGYSISYQNLVREFLQLDIPKGETRSDWLRRPLTDEQLAYAALDVAYLPEIFLKLEQQLNESGRLAWLAQECRQMQELAALDVDEQEWEQYYLGVGLAWKLSTAQLSRLRALCYWREKEARRRNKPRSWVARDNDLFAIAEAMPSDHQALQEIDNLPQQLLKRDAGSILRALQETRDYRAALAPEAISRPLSREYRTCLKKCQAFVRTRAEKLGIAPELLARKKQLLVLLDLWRHDPDFAWPPVLNGWRQPLLEQGLRALLSNCPGQEHK